MSKGKYIGPTLRQHRKKMPAALKNTKPLKTSRKRRIFTITNKKGQYQKNVATAGKMSFSLSGWSQAVVQPATNRSMGVPRKIAKEMHKHNETTPDLIEDEALFTARLRNN